MDVSTINSLITSVGFPIVCVLGLGWFIYQAFNKITAQSEKREEKLYDFLGKAQMVNEELTKTNAEFVAVLSTYKTDLAEIKEDVTEIKNNLKG